MRLVRSGIFWVDEEGETIDGDDLMSLLDAQPDGCALVIGAGDDDEDEDADSDERAVATAPEELDKPVFVRHSRR